MKSRGSLFYYGPYDQQVLLDGINRAFPRFRVALFAHLWALKHRLRFVDHSDPARFRIAGRQDGPQTRGDDAAPQARRVAAEAVPILVNIKHLPMR